MNGCVVSRQLVIYPLAGHNPLQLPIYPVQRLLHLGLVFVKFACPYLRGVCLQQKILFAGKQQETAYDIAYRDYSFHLSRL
jgi:hypothetical protein